MHQMRTEAEELKRLLDFKTIENELLIEESEKIKLENRFLKSEVERLKNNYNYIDKQLDDELAKSALLEKQVRQMRGLVQSEDDQNRGAFNP
jgi:cell division protein FtsB